MEIDAIAKEVSDTIQKEANCRAVFGEPLKLDTHVVIPVATVSVSGGAGGASGTGPKEAATEARPGTGMGLGGGLSIQVQPVGFIAEKDGQVVFTRIEIDAAFLPKMQLPPPIARLVGALRGHN